MGKFFRLALPLILIVTSIVVVIGLVAYKNSQRAERKADASPAILVDFMTARPQSVNLIVNSQGTLRPRTKTNIVAEVSGKIVSVSPEFVAGGFFHKGEVLLQIDPSDYRAGLKRAEAALASRKAKLAEETARSEQALKDWNNMNKQGQPSDLGLRKPQLAGAKANVSSAEADVEKARRDLERTRISIPYDGLVREKAVGIGQYVTPGTRLGVSFAIDTAEVRLPLANTDLQYLELPSGAQAEDKIKNFPPVTLSRYKTRDSDSWQARIIRTEGVVDEANRVVYTVAEVIDPYGVHGKSQQKEIKFGTFVNAAIQGLFAENIVVLPRYTLQPNNTVFEISDNDTLEILAVKVLRKEPKKVYISEGITAGTRIITTTLDAPVPGTKLTTSTHDSEPNTVNTSGKTP